MKRKNVAVINIVFLLLVFLGLMPQVSLAAGFIKFGDIKGESNDKDHKDWIEVLSYSGSVPKPGAQSRSTAGPSEITIVKQIDKASPNLSKACASGKSFPSVTIHFARTDGKPGYIKYTFQNVVIKSVNPGSGGSVPTENISLNYGSVSAAYTPQTEEGLKPKPKTWSPHK